MQLYLVKFLITTAVAWGASPFAERAMKAQDVAEYPLILKAYEYVSVKVIPTNVALEMTIVDASGSVVRAQPPFDRAMTIAFANDRPGTYRLRLATSAKLPGKSSGSIRFEDFKHLTSAARILPKPDARVDRANTHALVNELRDGKVTASRFWTLTQREGTPLIEPIKGDKIRMRATFLWRGDRDVRNVVVSMWPFSAAHQDEYKMEKVPGTDVWFKSLPLPRDARYLYSLAVNVPPIHAPDASQIVSAAEIADPLAKRNRPDDPHFSVSRFQTRSIIEMPDAPKQPWVDEVTGTPRGNVKTLDFRSEKLSATEELSIYIPAGYDPNGAAADVFILFDRLAYLSHVPAPTILDNLIARKQIPPTVAVLIGYPHPQDDNRTRQLTCNPTFSDFLKDELLPWVKQNYNVRVDHRHVIIGGSSFGGLASVCAGLHHPDTFRKILSQSGSFWWTKEFNVHAFDERADEEDPDRELADVMKMVLSKPRLPLKLYMDAGSKEIDPEGKGFDLLSSGRHLRDIFLAKGYEVKWQQFRGGHDYLSWRDTLADGLIYLNK